MLYFFHILSFVIVMFFVVVVLPLLFSSGDTTHFIIGTVTSVCLLAYIAYEWWQIIKEK